MCRILRKLAGLEFGVFGCAAAPVSSRFVFVERSEPQRHSLSAAVVVRRGPELKRALTMHCRATKIAKRHLPDSIDQRQTLHASIFRDQIIQKARSKNHKLPDPQNLETEAGFLGQRRKPYLSLFDGLVGCHALSKVCHRNSASNTAVPKFRVRIKPKPKRQTRNPEDLCEHRFGSLQDAFEAIDVEGVGIITREDLSEGQM